MHAFHEESWNQTLRSRFAQESFGTKAMWGTLERCARATELQSRIGQPLEQQVLPLLDAALAAFVQLVLGHLEAHRRDPRVQTLGCELLGSLLEDSSGQRCLAVDSDAGGSDLRLPCRAAGYR